MPWRSLNKYCQLINISKVSTIRKYLNFSLLSIINHSIVELFFKFSRIIRMIKSTRIIKDRCSLI